MPSNIFATTGTNVSIIFIDKTNQDDKIALVDASKLGEKIKEGKNQRTILSLDEEKQIADAFNSDEDVEDFSVHPTITEVKEKGYSLSAGQYFEIAIPIINMTEDEFNSHITGYQTELSRLFTESDRLGEVIKENIGKLKHEN